MSSKKIERKGSISALDARFDEMRSSMIAKRAEAEERDGGAPTRAYDTPDSEWPDRPRVSHFRLGSLNHQLTAESAIPCARCDANGYAHERVEDERGYRYAARCRCWEWRKRARILTTLTGLPASASRHTFDTLDWNAVAGRMALDGGPWSRGVLQDEINRVRLGGSRRPLRTGLLLFGETGVGKSHITQAMITSTVLDGGERAIWRHWPSWLSRFKSAMGGGRAEGRETTADVLDSLKEARVIALEELGGERITDFARAQLDEVLTMLGDGDHTLIVTTNHGANELAEQIGSRSVSRLLELCEIVEVDGLRGDWRAQR